MNNPFRRNHCLVLAVAACADLDIHATLALAENARRTPSCSGFAPLLSSAGYAKARALPDLEQWLILSGLYRVRQNDLWKTTGTARRFAREHPTGRYIIFTARHAQAAIDGRLYGLTRPLARIELVYQVEPYRKEKHEHAS